MLALLLNAAFAASDAPPCADLADAVGQYEAAVAAGRRAEWDDRHAAAQGALGCGPAAPPALLARLLNARGVAYLSLGRDADASWAFASAQGIRGAEWNPLFPPETQRIAAAATLPDGDGLLLLEPAPDPALQTLLDGVPTAFPAPVPLGFHVVQVLDPSVGDLALAGRTVLLTDPGEQLRIDFGPLAPTPPAPVARVRKPWLLWSGLGAATAAGLGAWGALAQSPQMEAADSKSALDAAWARQRALGYGSYAMAGLSAASLSLYFVL